MLSMRTRKRGHVLVGALLVFSMVLVIAQLALTAWGRHLIEDAPCVSADWLRGMRILSLAGRLPVLGARAIDHVYARSSQCVAMLAQSCDIRKAKAQARAHEELNRWFNRALTDVGSRPDESAQIHREYQKRLEALDWRPFVTEADRTPFCAAWRPYVDWLGANSDGTAASICSYCF